MKNTPTRAGEGKGRSRLRLPLLLLLLLAAGTAAWLIWGGAKPPGQNGGALVAFDPAAQDGHLPGKTAQQIQQELDQIVEEGMFNISISTRIEIAQGKGTANIENIAANPYHMRVRITLDSSGETVFESGAIKPGQYLQNIELSKALAPGDYAATATFLALDRDTMENVGQAAAKIVLVVQ